MFLPNPVSSFGMLEYQLFGVATIGLVIMRAAFGSVSCVLRHVPKNKNGNEDLIRYCAFLEGPKYGHRRAQAAVARHRSTVVDTRWVCCANIKN